ncbi:MAG: FkbM family methyltransferase [Phycisphaeraceae bacterium]
MEAPLDDLTGRVIYLTGDLDRKLTSLMRRILRPGDLFLDVGANLGLMTLQGSRLVGAQGMVIAFEPNPAVRELLKSSVERNGYRQVSVMDCALGKRESQAVLHVPMHNAGQATLMDDAYSGSVREVTIDVKRLDDVLDQLALKTNPRLLKIDVEGVELDVLRGASERLSHGVPDYVLFEHWGYRLGCGIEEDSLFACLLDYGYTIYGLPKAMIRLTLSRIKRSEPAMGSDFLAVSPHSQVTELGISVT